MNKIIIFDIAGTVLGSSDSTLRPGIKDTLNALKNRCWTVFFWTGGDVNYYARALHLCGIKTAVYSKYKPLPFTPDLYVDDNPTALYDKVTLKVESYASCAQRDISPIKFSSIERAFEERAVGDVG